jgi:glycosyltransferase involved in cell wall biosynthesis
MAELSTLRGLRVCFLAGTLGQGGAEKQMFYFASVLQRAGANVHVLCLTKGDFWEVKLREQGVTVEFVGGSRSRLRRMVAVIAAVKRFQPDLVQAQHFYVNGYAAIAARFCRVRGIGAIRGDGLADLFSCSLPFRKLNLNLPNCLAINSRAAIRNLVDIGVNNDNVRYLPNVIDVVRFKHRQTRDDTLPMIIGVGRLGPEKDFEFFLKVLAERRKLGGTPFRARLVGDGPMRKALHDLASKLGLLDGTLEFCGKVADVAPLYQEADFLMLTSEREGTPNVVMEAMACGLPVVATAVGDVPELVQNGISGYVLKGGDMRGFLSSVETLLNDSVLCESMGRHGRALIEAGNDLARLPGMLNNLYADVLS